jgi:hypothetical protein
MRKYEIHLPLSYEDGKPIERAKIKRACDELVASFGSFAVPRRRAWKYDGVKYIEIMKIEILTAEDKIPTKLLKDFRKRLKESFRQTDILITTHRIQTA